MRVIYTYLPDKQAAINDMNGVQRQILLIELRVCQSPDYWG